MENVLLSVLIDMLSADEEMRRVEREKKKGKKTRRNDARRRTS
jgi:hypothetical protein